MSELVLYTSADGLTRLDLRVEGETVWLSQLEIAELFQTTKQNVSLHTKNIFEDGELSPEATVKESLTVQTEGERQVKRRIQLYNLDLILAKNYLSEDEVDTLNRLVVIFLEQAELRARQRQDLTLDYWRENVDRMLEFNEQAVLEGAGTVSREQMKEIAEARYADFDAQRRSAEALAADAEDLRAIEELEKGLTRKGGEV